LLPSLTWRADQSRFLSDPADFALRLLHKDVGLAVGLGREVGVPMRLANMAFEELTEAMNRGRGTTRQVNTI